MPSTVPSKKIDLGGVLKKAKDSIDTKKRRWILTGPTGSGKTHVLKTIPKGDTLLYLDVDGKGQMLRNDPDLQETMDIMDIQWSSDVGDESGRTAASERISIVELGLNSLLEQQDEKNEKEIAESNREIDRDVPKKLIPPSTYQWGCIDSLTNFFKLAEYKSKKLIPGGGIWSKNFDNMKAEDVWFWTMLNKVAGLCDNVILCAHEDFRQSETGVGYKVIPLARKALSETMPGRFQENYRCFVAGDGENPLHCFQTRPEGLWQCNTGIEGLPFIVPNNLELITTTDWSKKGLKDAITEYEKRTRRKVTRFKA